MQRCRHGHEEAIVSTLWERSRTFAKHLSKTPSNHHPSLHRQENELILHSLAQLPPQFRYGSRPAAAGRKEGEAGLGDGSNGSSVVSAFDRLIHRPPLLVVSLQLILYCINSVPTANNSLSKNCIPRIRPWVPRRWTCRSCPLAMPRSTKTTKSSNANTVPANVTPIRLNFAPLR